MKQRTSATLAQKPKRVCGVQGCERRPRRGAFCGPHRGAAARVCRWCAKPFVLEGGRREPWFRYCSDECSSAARRKRSHGEKLKIKYGVSKADYFAMLEAQDGVCAICDQPETTEGRRWLSLDHDHETGEPRGLLCSRCNLAVGLMNDSEQRFRAAADYLARFGSKAP